MVYVCYLVTLWDIISFLSSILSWAYVDELMRTTCCKLVCMIIKNLKMKRITCRWSSALVVFKFFDGFKLICFVIPFLFLSFFFMLKLPTFPVTASSFLFVMLIKWDRFFHFQGSYQVAMVSEKKKACPFTPAVEKSVCTWWKTPWRRTEAFEDSSQWGKLLLPPPCLLILDKLNISCCCI